MPYNNDEFSFDDVMFGSPPVPTPELTPTNSPRSTPTETTPQKPWGKDFPSDFFGKENLQPKADAEQSSKGTPIPPRRVKAPVKKGLAAKPRTVAVSHSHVKSALFFCEINEESEFTEHNIVKVDSFLNKQEILILIKGVTKHYIRKESEDEVASPDLLSALDKIDSEVDTFKFKNKMNNNRNQFTYDMLFWCEPYEPNSTLDHLAEAFLLKELDTRINMPKLFWHKHISVLNISISIICEEIANKKIEISQLQEKVKEANLPSPLNQRDQKIKALELFLKNNYGGKLKMFGKVLNKITGDIANKRMAMVKSNMPASKTKEKDLKTLNTMFQEIAQLNHEIKNGGNKTNNEQLSIVINEGKLADRTKHVKELATLKAKYIEQLTCVKKALTNHDSTKEQTTNSKNFY